MRRIINEVHINNVTKYDVCPMCGEKINEVLDVCDDCWEELMAASTPGNYK